ncbi:hypothetical protein Tco_0935934, partial [Tanacetum coccineum]
VRTTLEAKKTWWLRLGARVYDSWKLQGYVEELWDELPKLGLVVLAVLVTEASQSRQHVSTSLINIESCKLPTAKLFEVDSGRISIRHCEY